MMNATPDAKRAVPTSSPTRLGTAAITHSPAADAASAEPDRATAPTRSGSRAPTIRSAMTIRPYSASGIVAPSSPIVRAYSGRNDR